MGVLESYLLRTGKQQPLLSADPPAKLSYTLVIPAFAEDGIQSVLNSLNGAGRPHGKNTEVLVVFNYPPGASAELLQIHSRSLLTTREWIDTHASDGIDFYMIDGKNDGPRRYGAGYARKLGMDEAVFRFARVKNPGGVILSLDADALVDTDYLLAVDKYFSENQHIAGCSIPFEHPVEGKAYPPAVYEGIRQYELHLRYHVQALKFAGFPYAFHTIGSCFAVRASAYAIQGGMNLRQGGEDFYFLQKVIETGRFGELTGTFVRPSPRPSLRVPFGTGPVMHEWLDKGRKELYTYDLESYLWLRDFFPRIGNFYLQSPEKTIEMLDNCPVPLKEFLIGHDFPRANEEIIRNVASLNSYTKRFFKWFNGFRVVKYLNFCHRSYLKKMPVVTEALRLLALRGIPANTSDPRELLGIFRKMDRGF